MMQEFDDMQGCEDCALVNIGPVELNNIEPSKNKIHRIKMCRSHYRAEQCRACWFFYKCNDQIDLIEETTN